MSLIARKEMRDLLRDRRSVFLALGLPALIYPAFVVVGLAFAFTLLGQSTAVGVVGAEYLPPEPEYPEALLAGGVYVLEADRRADVSFLKDGQFDPRFLRSITAGSRLTAMPFATSDESALATREVDALIFVPSDLRERLARGERATIRVVGREGDENSKLAVARIEGMLERWRGHLKGARFARHGLPPDFDQPVAVTTPDDHKSMESRTADELRDVLVKFLPFLLVMWTMAGALHPAIDLTAGEKERGTMETLLISPAGRGEIVTGKFLAVFVFSYGTSIWNLMWMAAGTTIMALVTGASVISPLGLVWAGVLAAPLAALFSSLALGLGVFARSSKEGQYYLLPLMLITLPLCLFAMSPGLKLSPFLSAVPVTGLTMILQNLIAVSGEPISAASWVAGLGSLAGGVVLALLWAAWQFRREAVLFRGDGGPMLRFWRRRPAAQPIGPSSPLGP